MDLYLPHSLYILSCFHIKSFMLAVTCPLKWSIITIYIRCYYLKRAPFTIYMYKWQNHILSVLVHRFLSQPAFRAWDIPCQLLILDGTKQFDCINKLHRKKVHWIIPQKLMLAIWCLSGLKVGHTYWPIWPLTHRAIRIWPTYDSLVTHMLNFSF